MKKIPILIISFALVLFSVSFASADEVTGNFGNNGFVSGLGGGIPNDPVASPASGHSSLSAFNVTLSATDSTSIRYTVDGSTPACPSTGTLYASPFSITSSKTVKAIACYGSGSTVPSNVKSFSYTITVNSGGGGGGGGGGGVTYCTSVTYADWQTTCTGGLQFRNVTSQAPYSCTLTSVQQLATQRACTTPSATSTPPSATSTPPAGDGGSTPTSASSTPGTTLLQNIATEAQILNTEDTNNLLNHLGSGASTTLEQAGLTKYKTILGLDKTISADDKLTINDFIVYGTQSTQRLGAGERAAVINSYYQAYKKLPNSEAEWSDVIKIANGRWPSERSAAAEAQAKIEFKKVYARNAVMTNNIDENAIMVIAYGLLPLQRNLASEKVAIVTFKWVYGHAPVNALAWNIVRAIAYSGAKR